MSQEAAQLLALDNDCLHFLSEIKDQVRQSRVKAALAANAKIIEMYWKIGQGILDRQKTSNWGSKLLEQLSKDLTNAFPDAHGFSITNLKRMKQFAVEFPDLEQIGAQVVPQLHV